MTTANALVMKLNTLGYVVQGPSYQILRHHGQPMMNKAAGEAAPTWELLVNPIYNTVTGRIYHNGTHPQVRLPDGRLVTAVICSHLPLTHILKQPLSEWSINEDAEYHDMVRLTIETKCLPENW